MRISDQIREIENAVRQYAFVRRVARVDETYYSIKYHLHIAPELFVQLYFNEQSGTVGWCWFIADSEFTEGTAKRVVGIAIPSMIPLYTTFHQRARNLSV